MRFGASSIPFLILKAGESRLDAPVKLYLPSTISLEVSS